MDHFSWLELENKTIWFNVFLEWKFFKFNNRRCGFFGKFLSGTDKYWNPVPAFPIDFEFGGKVRFGI